MICHVPHKILSRNDFGNTAVTVTFLVASVGDKEEVRKVTSLYSYAEDGALAVAQKLYRCKLSDITIFEIDWAFSVSYLSIQDAFGWYMCRILTFKVKQGHPDNSIFDCSCSEHNQRAQ